MFPIKKKKKIWKKYTNRLYEHMIKHGILTHTQKKTKHTHTKHAKSTHVNLPAIFF